MSDSDNDLLTNSVFTFQNGNTTVCGKGPNINSTNIGFSFRHNNMLTSTMNMPRNFERQRYAESSYDQRSMYYRRETSPMSMYSGSDRRHNTQNCYYARGGSQRSMVNGRSGSPMSVRSIDSSATVSATDIAQAFKSMNFNKYDLRIIKDAYNKFMKTRIRKRIEKRRNMRLFLKGVRNRGGEDSGEQGSDSSISSDDCRSIRTTTFKENMSSCRSTKTDISDFRRTLTDKNIFKEYTEQQNALKHRFTQPANMNQSRLQNPTVLQRDRFRNGFLLPSQRFNRSVAALSIPEKSDGWKNNNNIINNRQDVNLKTRPANMDNATDSDQGEIFSEVTVRENAGHNNTSQLKRNRDIEDDICNIDSKRTKLSSPRKNNGEIQRNTVKQIDNANKESNDFEFVKPQFPIRKSNNQKPQEKLISRSKPVVSLDEPVNNVPATNVPIPQPTNECAMEVEEAIPEKDQPDVPENTTTDVSMRPSFIKRKLFTQRLEVTENKNTSIDSLTANSPKTVYSAIQKEKNKARKLVTNQSCLNRDVLQEDNNLLDLIHKIVPPEHINVTTTNKTNNVSNKNSIDADDKWDITSIISTCNNDNVSDTYTDEEIFKAPDANVKNNVQKEKPKKTPKQKNTNKQSPCPNQKQAECKIVVERLPKDISVPCKIINAVQQPGVKKNVNNYVKSFWDTDFESDIEVAGPREQSRMVKQTQQVKPGPKEYFNIGPSNSENNINQSKNNVEHIKSPVTMKRYSSKSTAAKPELNDTVLKVQNLHNVSLSIRTHRDSKAKSLAKPLNNDIEKSRIESRITKKNETSKSIKTDTVKKSNPKTSSTYKKEKTDNSKPKTTTSTENKNKNDDRKPKPTSTEKKEIIDKPKPKTASTENKEKDSNPKPKTKRVPKTKKGACIELNQSKGDDSMNKTLRTRTIDVSINKNDKSNKKKSNVTKKVPAKKATPIKIKVVKKSTPKKLTKTTPMPKLSPIKTVSPVKKLSPIKKVSPVKKLSPIKKVVTTKVTARKATPIKKMTRCKDMSANLTSDLSKSNLSFTLRPRRQTSKARKI